MSYAPNAQSRGHVPLIPSLSLPNACQGLNDPRLLLLEQLVGGGAMGLNAVDVSFDASDLGLQSFDPGVQLIDRDGVEILLCKLDQRVARLARKEIVQVHR